MGRSSTLNIFGKSLFQPEYCIIKKAFEEELPNDNTIRLFDNQDEIMTLNISPILVVEEMSKSIADKSDIEFKFYESAEDVSDSGKLSSGKKNLMVFDYLLLEKENTCETYYVRRRHSIVDCFYL